VRRIVLGLVLLGAGLAALYAFRDPVVTYTVELVGSGDEAGQLVEAECQGGVPVGRFEGDARAESECLLAEDEAETLRVIKLIAGAVVAIAGIYFVYAGYRLWYRDFHSSREYHRMVKDHERAAKSDRQQR
jgi:hypothetical protein